MVMQPEATAWKRIGMAAAARVYPMRSPEQHLRLVTVKARRAQAHEEDI